MKTKSLLPRIGAFGFVLLALGVSSSHASVIVSTSFAGSAAAPTGNTGLSSSVWASTAGGATASSATFTPGTMGGTLPTGYTDSGFINTGNFIQTQNSPAFGTLTTPIDVDTAGTTYFSFLYRVTAADSTEGGGLSFFNGTTEQFQVGLGLNNSIRIIPINPLGTATYTANNSFVTGTDTAWIVGKIDTTTGADTISLNVYTGSESVPSIEPGSFELSKSYTIASDLTTIRFNSPSGEPAQQFDEFRLGQTWSDVTVAVPEPSSAVLIGFAMFIYALGRRRVNPTSATGS
jgi:hypothetical protein